MQQGAYDNTRGADYRVLIKRCETYDHDVIAELINAGMEALDYTPSGRVFVKPNVVYASRKGQHGTTAWTHASVISAALQALASAPAATRVDLGENMGIGFPTRMCFKYAGYYDAVKRARKRAKRPVGIFCIDEELRDEVFVGGKVHHTLRVARKMARADTMVYLPKLKCHCVTTITGAVKLNIGICSDDERAIRHDFLLNQKIVDLLVPGYPDFIVMDAIDVGIGNELTPTARRLGLLIMGRNPVAVDLVGARLLGYNRDDVPYLKLAMERGYTPAQLDAVTLLGDITSVAAIDEQAKRIMPYDDEFLRWQDINKEFARLDTPLRFVWGPSLPEDKSVCATGCLMGLKTYFSILEWHAGAEAFRHARPATFVIGRPEETIDARGGDVFIIGSCSNATITNARKIKRFEKCFTTASDLTIGIGGKLGIPTPIHEASSLMPLFYYMSRAALRKAISLRYLQDALHFLKKGFIRKI